MSRLLLDGWQVVIGIETHAQIKSSQKLFSSARTSSLSPLPNTTFNTFDAAFPGTLPRLNSKCLFLALRAAVALNCDVHPRSSFDRKHYFYPDLPSGYQITQHYAPFASNGFLKLPKHNKSVRIKQIQMEQDTAKSSHNSRMKVNEIDLNRAGTGLLEIVTEPDLGSVEETAEYVKTLQAVLRAVGASDGNMEAGSLRCDVNVSINRPGEAPGTRCELKNLNSVKFMVAAINYEVQRQRDILSDPTTYPAGVPQETRAFDQHKWETFRLRSKEDAPDYRYMPDANLGYVHVTESQLDGIKKTLPLLPAARKQQMVEAYGQHGVTENDIDILMAVDSGRGVVYDGEESEDDSPAGYFEALCRPGRNPKVVANWTVHSLLGELSKLEKSFSEKPSLEQMGDLIDLVESGSLTRSSSKLLLRHLLNNPDQSSISVKDLARDLDLISFSSAPSSGGAEDGDLVSICQQAIDAMPSEIEAIRSGRHNVMNKVVGWAMKQTRGKVDANAVKATLKEMLGV